MFIFIQQTNRERFFHTGNLINLISRVGMTQNVTKSCVSEKMIYCSKPINLFLYSGKVVCSQRTSCGGLEGLCILLKRLAHPCRYTDIQAGESRCRAPGRASDYALRAPNPLDNSTMTRSFIKISSPLTSPGHRYFAPPLLAGLD